MFLPDEKDIVEEPMSHIIVEECAEMVLTQVKGTNNWAVTKDELSGPCGELVGGHTAAHHIQLAVLEKLGLRGKKT